VIICDRSQDPGVRAGRRRRGRVPAPECLQKGAV